MSGQVTTACLMVSLLAVIQAGKTRSTYRHIIIIIIGRFVVLLKHQKLRTAARMRAVRCSRMGAVGIPSLAGFATPALSPRGSPPSTASEVTSVDRYSLLPRPRTRQKGSGEAGREGDTTLECTKTQLTSYHHFEPRILINTGVYAHPITAHSKVQRPCRSARDPV